MKNKVRCYFLLFTILITACKKKDNVPSVLVDAYLNLQLPQYIKIQTPLNWVYYYGAGSSGIIVYRKSGSEFCILERTCTFDPSKSTAQVQVLPDNFTSIDSTCGSKFSISDGSILNGPATQPLLQYHYDFDGTTLHIYN